MKRTKIVIMACCLFLGMTASAQDTKSQFNPIQHAVISQTIAPDARAAGMGETRNTGTLRSILSASAGLVLH